MWGKKEDPRPVAKPRRSGEWAELIHAYVDDMLPPRQRLEVEEYLALHPEETRRVADFRNQNRGLHDLYDHYLLEPLPGPARLLEQRIVEKLSRRRTMGTMTRMAAAAAILALVAGGSWYGARYHFTTSGPEIDFAALSSNASQDGETGRPRTDGDVQRANLTADGGAAGGGAKSAESNAPDLSRFGFRLTGSREVSQSGGAEAAQLVYESEKGRQVMLYCSPTEDNGSQKITFTQQGPISILVWNRGGRSFSMIGDVDRETMLAIGAAVNAGWLRPPPPRLQSGGDKSPPEPSDTPRKKSGDRTDATQNPGEPQMQPAVSQE